MMLGVYLKCEKCGALLEITSKIIDGKKLRCPKCEGTIFIVERTNQIEDDPLTEKLTELDRQRGEPKH